MTALIPRADLFNASLRADAKLSPNGKYIAFVGRLQGVDNIWLAPADDLASAQPVTRDTKSGIRQFHWGRNSTHLIFSRDNDGDEKWRFVSHALEHHKQVMLSPDNRAETRIVAFSNHYPDEILIENNGRDAQYFDIYRVNIVTGDIQLVEQNTQFTWIYADQYLRPRLAEQRTEDGGIVYHAAGGDGGWRPLIKVGHEDEHSTRPFRIFESPNTFSSDAQEIYAMDSRGRNTAALVAWDLTSGATRFIASDDRADIDGIVTDPGTQDILAYSTNYQYQEYHAAGAKLESILTGGPPATITVVSQSNDNRLWTVSVSRPDEAEHYFLYDTGSGERTELFASNPALTGITLARMFPAVIQSRDNLELVSYVSLPGHAGIDQQGIPEKPLPMVVLVHGGPWIRDSYAFDPWIQFLANRGYAVLNVNYRGSRGFGKAFLNAGDREWGGKMYDDVVDAVRWTVDRRIAQPESIAIMGASFGGYTTLMGLTRSPDLFTCGIDLFGVSNLESFLASIPPYWKAFKRMWDQRVGTTDTAAERALLRQRSPLHQVERITKPLLIGQGSNDPRVPQAESDQIAKILNDRGVEVTYLLFPDEGHAFLQPQNQLCFFAVVEAFLATHLGGRSEPMTTALQRSSVKVPFGIKHIPGLAPALNNG